MTNRRVFITLVPFAGAGLLAACSKETTVPSSTPAPAPAAPPAAAPAPAMAAPAPARSSTGAAPATSAGASLPLLEPSDPVAVGLGYVAVASSADSSKYKTHAPGQACANCSLFAGKAGDAQGPCPLFAGKHVLATGWCSAYVKKAG
jgi:hypothetical protein